MSANLHTPKMEPHDSKQLAKPQTWAHNKRPEEPVARMARKVIPSLSPPNSVEKKVCGPITDLFTDEWERIHHEHVRQMLEFSPAQLSRPWSQMNDLIGTLFQGCHGCPDNLWQNRVYGAQMIGGFQALTACRGFGIPDALLLCDLSGSLKSGLKKYDMARQADVLEIRQYSFAILEWISQVIGSYSPSVPPDDERKDMDDDEGSPRFEVISFDRDHECLTVFFIHHEIRIRLAWTDHILSEHLTFSAVDSQPNTYLRPMPLDSWKPVCEALFQQQFRWRQIHDHRSGVSNGDSIEERDFFLRNNRHSCSLMAVYLLRDGISWDNRAALTAIKFFKIWLKWVLIKEKSFKSLAYPGSAIFETLVWQECVDTKRKCYLGLHFRPGKKPEWKFTYIVFHVFESLKEIAERLEQDEKSKVYITVTENRVQPWKEHLEWANRQDFPGVWLADPVTPAMNILPREWSHNPALWKKLGEWAGKWIEKWSNLDNWQERKDEFVADYRDMARDLGLPQNEKPRREQRYLSDTSESMPHGGGNHPPHPGQQRPYGSVNHHFSRQAHVRNHQYPRPMALPPFQRYPPQSYHFGYGYPPVYHPGYPAGYMPMPVQYHHHHPSQQIPNRRRLDDDRQAVIVERNAKRAITKGAHAMPIVAHPHGQSEGSTVPPSVPSVPDSRAVPESPVVQHSPQRRFNDESNSRTGHFHISEEQRRATCDRFRSVREDCGPRASREQHVAWVLGCVNRSRDKRLDLDSLTEMYWVRTKQGNSERSETAMQIRRDRVLDASNCRDAVALGLTQQKSYGKIYFAIM